MCCFSALFLLGQLCYLVESGKHIIIATGAMRNQAAGAILNSLFCIGKISSAFISQGIQRTVAEHAIKMAGVRNFMTGKIFTVPVLEIATGIIHGKHLLFHKFSHTALCYHRLLSKNSQPLFLQEIRKTGPLGRYP